jgi:transposase
VVGGVSVFVRVKKTGNYSYAQIVQNYREDGKVKQRIIATLGQYEELSESGKLDALARSLLKYTTAVQAIDALRDGSLRARRTLKLGPALVFDRLWHELGIAEVLGELLETTRYRVHIERAIFITVLNRLFESGSDRSAERWKVDYKIEGADEIKLQHFYRAMGWLGEGILQLGSDPKTFRLRKDLIEERLFTRNRDLFSDLEIAFFDTTSLYFEGAGGESLGQYGHSKDSRPDLKQLIVGAVLDGNGRPICCELWPGNVSDVSALMPVVERLRERFGIERVCVVADRGMISVSTIEALESQGISYILGVRMRKTAEIQDELSSDEASFTVVDGPRTMVNDPSALAVREKEIEGHRYIICRNEDQARKDSSDRAAIIESLQEHLRHGDKSLVGNNGYRKFLKVSTAEHFSIDEQKIEDEARYDGTWVLRTNTSFSAEDVARKYKELWMVEDVFRSMKSVFSTRPIYHKVDDTIRGHVFCSFLALLLLHELASRLEKRQVKAEWCDVKRDLSALEEVELEVEGQPVFLRTDVRGVCGKVLQAVGVAAPPTVRAHD